MIVIDDDCHDAMIDYVIVTGGHGRVAGVHEERAGACAGVGLGKGVHGVRQAQLRATSNSSTSQAPGPAFMLPLSTRCRTWAHRHQAPCGMACVRTGAAIRLAGAYVQVPGAQWTKHLRTGTRHLAGGGEQARTGTRRHVAWRVCAHVLSNAHGMREGQARRARGLARVLQVIPRRD